MRSKEVLPALKTPERESKAKTGEAAVTMDVDASNDTDEDATLLQQKPQATSKDATKVR